ncbi:unnamed protein product, partial [Urochloa humidicola]
REAIFVSLPSLFLFSFFEAELLDTGDTVTAEVRRDPDELVGGALYRAGGAAPRRPRARVFPVAWLGAGSFPSLG